VVLEISWVRSRIAPAVLGLESVSSRVDVRESGTGLSLPLGDAAETIEEMLPETECPGRAVTVLDVSLETRDSGLGINSSVSENPTRAFGTALLCFGLPSGEQCAEAGCLASSGCYVGVAWGSS